MRIERAAGEADIGRPLVPIALHEIATSAQDTNGQSAADRFAIRDEIGPHALVQEYLNRSDALWGIVTNGRQLRILRNTTRFSKPTYIEFDLDAMMRGGLYSEFVLFYRLAHATRLPTGASDAHACFIERYHQQGIEAGGRVREKLRDGVREALEILGTGFLAHAASEAAETIVSVSGAMSATK